MLPEGSWQFTETASHCRSGNRLPVVPLVPWGVPQTPTVAYSWYIRFSGIWWQIYYGWLEKWNRGFPCGRATTEARAKRLLRDTTKGYRSKRLQIPRLLAELMTNYEIHFRQIDRKIIETMAHQGQEESEFFIQLLTADNKTPAWTSHATTLLPVSHQPRLVWRILRGSVEQFCLLSPSLKDSVLRVVIS